MNRRSFLQSILALGAAPAIVKAESLMKLWVPPQEIILARDFAVMNPGQWHRIGVQYSWLGAGKTRFFLDGREVPGIAGVEFKQSDGSFSIGAENGATWFSTPGHVPGTESRFEASMKIEDPKSIAVQSVMVESGNLPPLIYEAQPVHTAAFKSEDWVAPKLPSLTRKLLERI